ncbi:helix-turn-helix domain-containing protein [Sphingomonas sp. H39-1-10]|uniref:winged helix-turn-helix transcriptional regulator n=1 Tax=Sphingomonas pollutisoli TaxID=3030829 RepID=UPI0023B9A8BE|nr:helix-turn-helix domain-containing protein [Sphingomonas pollutisoli]MDF0488336.1 helix-turn-helix domain-containing protein [Sphingomonas pollutisoli]
MDIDDLSSGACPVGRGLARVGDTWSMLILRNAGLGQTRFDQFQKTLGIAPNILTRRLAALVAAGLLERRRYSARPPRDEYVLTEAGRDYLPVLHALGGWARKHFGGGAMTRPVEAGSGRDIVPVVVDARSGVPLADLAIAMAP